MVNNRLVWYLESRELLSNRQFGFRKNRTLDPLLILSREIQNAFARRHQTIGVFFDLEKAYDTTWRGGILKQLASWGIGGHMFAFVQNFLSNRRLKVRVGSPLNGLTGEVSSSYLKKTKAIRFTMCRKREEIPTLFLKGVILPYESEMKFLGVIFDKGLTFVTHVNDLCARIPKPLEVRLEKESREIGLYDSTIAKLGPTKYPPWCKPPVEICICTGGKQHHNPQAVKAQFLEHSSKYNTSIFVYTDGSKSKQGVGSAAVFNGKIIKHSNSVLASLRQLLPTHPLVQEVQDWLVLLHSRKRTKVNFCWVPGHTGAASWGMKRQISFTVGSFKEYQLDAEIKGLFLEHITEHLDSTFVFTGGSKTDAGVGYGVFSDNHSCRGALPITASNFTAELFGILTALEHIITQQTSNFTIFCDSICALQAIEIFSDDNPLTIKISHWVFLLQCRGITISFCWVPAHVHIYGNEKADQLAKSATTSLIPKRCAIPYRDILPSITNIIHKSWKQQWSDVGLNKMKEITKNIHPWKYEIMPRKWEVIICRLRIGQSRLTHGYLMSGENQPYCEDSLITMTIKHLLVECPSYRELREHHFPNKKKRDGNYSLAKILGKELQYDYEGVIKFLKEVNLLDQI
ncbi:uncharacterized protein LOC143024529 [Oratosquilla oratoria]|uniref:uncharacterized protein LOC143024529 n=1 Tax=Oratosquilla oratoria TaxID=337810 RepID=UPI003F7611A4